MTTHCPRLALPALFALPLPAFLSPTDPAPLPPPSDQVGVYARIDKVEFHPDEAKATRVLVSGAFAVGEATNGNYYRAPVWGCIAYEIDPKTPDECRAQWSDLKSVAGTEAIVGFGFRFHQGDVRVHPPGQQDVPSIRFHSGMGVHKNRNSDYGPLLQLRCLPRPRAPLAGDTVRCSDTWDNRPETDIELTVDNCPDASDDLRYLFEIERSNGDVRGSAPIPAGDKQTSWRTTVALTPGEKIRWRCRVIRKKLEVAPVARAEFTVIAPPPADAR